MSNADAATPTAEDMKAACASAIESLNPDGKWTAGDVGNYTAAFFTGWNARSNFAPAERTRVEGERNTIRDEQVIANLQMRLKRAELIPSERQHLLALLMKERESGDYQGNQARYYQVRDRLIKRLSQE